MQTSIQNTPESWQLTEQELNDMEYVKAEEMYSNAAAVAARERAYEMGLNYRPDECLPVLSKRKFSVRVQQINLYEIEVEANNANEAEAQALDALTENTELGQLLRSDFGHTTIEKL